MNENRMIPMIFSTIRILAISWIVLIVPISSSGAEPFRYPEAKHGKGELRYIDHIPVLIVQGTPEFAPIISEPKS